jgi:hypothetical protein
MMLDFILGFAVAALLVGSLIGLIKLGIWVLM